MSAAAGVLVVDDERQIVDLLTRYLLQHGFRAVGAYTPEEARARVVADPGIGVLVSDLRMPGQSGLALAQELLAGRRETDALEVVVITGAGLSDPAFEALGERNCDVLRKPFRPSEVAAAAARALARSEQRRMRANRAAGPRALPGAEPRLGPSEAEERALLAAIVGRLRAPLLPMIAAAETLADGPPPSEAELRAQGRAMLEAGLGLLAVIDEALGALTQGAGGEPGEAARMTAR